MKSAAALLILAGLVGLCWFTLTNVILMPPPDTIVGKLYRAESYARLALSEDLLPRGATLTETTERLRDAGFQLQAEAADRRPPDRTHRFVREGRNHVLCGELLFVDIDIADDQLVNASGQAQWSCL